MKTEIVKLSQIQVNAANPRSITEEKFTKLINSILVLPKMLAIRPIVVDNTMTALGGNMRLRALTTIEGMTENEITKSLNQCRSFCRKTETEQETLIDYWRAWKDSPTAHVIKASDLTDDEQREFIIKDNVGYGDWDWDSLANEWDTDELIDWGLDVWDNNTNEDEEPTPPMKATPENSLFDLFIVPPFSILDTRRGYWQDRKSKWREFIGDSGESRNDKLYRSNEMKYKTLYQSTRLHRKELGISFSEYLEKYVPADVKERAEESVTAKGVSLFDPVVSEVLSKWFTPRPGAKIFDCFAGDTQKGLVFGKCGFEFIGIELRQEQVEVNNKVIQGRNLPIRYINDDGQNVAKHIAPNSQDLLFSCPPYYNLEVYSDLENDASNQKTYEEFIQILSNAFMSAITCLKDNRFAVIVVGDVRDKKTGFYYDFAGDIKNIFKEAGLRLYNEIILVETSATAALRANGSMDSRKVVKVHQNILVFYKGDTQRIKDEFKKIDFTEEDMKLFESIAQEYAPKDEAQQTLDGDDIDVVFDCCAANDAKYDVILRELLDFRKPYQKDGYIAYERYPKIKEAIASGDIHIERNEAGQIVGYIWLENLKRKPLSRIYEICSSVKGVGRKLIEYAIARKKHETLELFVVDFNENAINFYKHMGFVEVERETGKKVNNLTMRYKGGS